MADLPLTVTLITGPRPPRPERPLALVHSDPAIPTRPRMSVDTVARAQENLAVAEAALAGADTELMRRKIRTNIAQLVAYLKAQGVEVPS